MPSMQLVPVGSRSPAEIRSSNLHPASFVVVHQGGGRQKKKGGGGRKKKARNRRAGTVSSVAVRSGGHIQGSATEDMLKYVLVLTHPFDAMPVRLGAETMMPSGLATFTQRQIVTLPSSGNLSVVIYPWAQNYLFSSNTATSPYTYSNIAVGSAVVNFPGGSSLASVASGSRVVAMGVRCMTTSSATNDQGIITIGCLPRDTSASTSVTLGGFPISTGATTATQGFNEFFNYLQTESYPLRQGASAFWRPQDPLDYIFEADAVQNGTVTSAGVLLDPFFVIGISNAASASVLFLEVILHLEYTVAEGSTGLIDTGQGNMGMSEVVGAVRHAFGNVVDTTKQGVIGGLTKFIGSAGTALGKAAMKAIGAGAGAASGYLFGNSTLPRLTA